MSWFHAVANPPTQMLLRQRTGHSDFAGVSSAAFARRRMLLGKRVRCGDARKVFPASCKLLRRSLLPEGCCSGQRNGSGS